MIGLRILTEDYPGLTRWALSAMACILIGQADCREDTQRRKRGSVTTEVEIGLMWSQAEESWSHRNLRVSGQTLP